MGMKNWKATFWQGKRIVVLATLMVICLLLMPSLVQYYQESPQDRLAKRFYHTDDRGLHWDYAAMLKAYKECRDSMRQQQMLDLMVTSRAMDLVPGIIDSITPGGFMDTERKIRTIIKLTGHDFSKEFDIASVAGTPDTNDTKTKLHQWWTANRQEVIQATASQKIYWTPSGWSGLTLKLTTEKSQYSDLEPIRLTAVLENHNVLEYTFSDRRPTPAFKLEFYRVADTGDMTKICETRYPEKWIICGYVSRWFAPVGHLAIKPGSCHITKLWGNNVDGNHIKLGRGAIRAVLTPLRGKDRNRHLVSNDVDIELVTPQGDDGLAYQFLIGKQPANMTNAQGYGRGWARSSNLIQNSNRNGDYDAPADEYFVNSFGGSIYAHYVRFAQADAAKWYRDQARSQPSYPLYSAAGPQIVKRLTEIIQTAPKDFPLFADACADLLEHYKGTGEIDKMAAVAETIKLSELKIADPTLSQRQTDLIAYPGEVVANIHHKDRFGRTSLYEAAENGTLQQVEFLIRKGADINAVSSWGTPLNVAVKTGRKDIVEALISSGADVNLGAASCTPLYSAAVKGDKAMVELLLAHGAEVNVGLVEENLHQREIARILMRTKGRGGKTPLHLAVEHGKVGKVERLLRNGAPITEKDDTGRTPLDIARTLPVDKTDATAIISLLEEYSRAAKPGLP
jgi:ankyrin repeat protein